MKRLIAILICSLLVLTSVGFCFSTPSVYAATEEELEQELARIEAEIKANKKKIKSLDGEKESQQEYLDTLKSQIESVQKKADALNNQVKIIDNAINLCNTQIKQLKNEISTLVDEVSLAETQIKETTKNIENSKDELSAKIRASYINGNQSTLKILMGSDSLASFLTRLEMMKRMSENDKKVIDDFKKEAVLLKESKEKLQEKQAELVAKQQKIEETKQTAVEKKKELAEKQNEHKAAIAQLENDYKKVQNYIDKLDKSSSVYENYIKNLEAERAAADKEIEEIIKSYQATTTTQVANVIETTHYASNGDPSKDTSNQSTTVPSYESSASWGWPVGNYPCYISSGYGNRSASISGWSFHGGTDIAGSGIHGQPVYASRAGTVIAAVWGTTGYGRYVVLDHGDGYSTVYGHCSNLLVSQGQYVAKGQKIAEVGSTGNSTGPHLHFEVRYNGVKQNPMNYVTKP